jgi:hypothetical protein
VLWLLVWCFALTGALQAEDSSGYISVLAISLFWTVQVCAADQWPYPVPPPGL